jgi:hypothetical protein
LDLSLLRDIYRKFDKPTEASEVQRRLDALGTVLMFDYHLNSYTAQDAEKTFYGDNSESPAGPEIKETPTEQYGSSAST